jgi:hypothetical protein
MPSTRAPYNERCVRWVALAVEDGGGGKGLTLRVCLDVCARVGVWVCAEGVG